MRCSLVRAAILMAAATAMLATARPARGDNPCSVYGICAHIPSTADLEKANPLIPQ